MAGKKNVLIIAFILIVLGIAAYFALFSKPELSFAGGKTQLDSILSKNKLSLAELQNAIELPEKSALTGAKNNISLFSENLSKYRETTDTIALKDLSALYAGFLDSLIDTKAIEEKAIQLGSSEATTTEELCALIPNIEGIVSDSEKVLAKTKTLNSKIAIFETSYPQFASTAELDSIKTSEEEIQTAIDQAKADVETQKETCTTA